MVWIYSVEVLWLFHVFSALVPLDLKGNILLRALDSFLLDFHVLLLTATLLALASLLLIIFVPGSDLLDGGEGLGEHGLDLALRKLDLDLAALDVLVFLLLFSHVYETCKLSEEVIFNFLINRLDQN